MCNACGFGCCALDTFEGCGCDSCDNPDCWPTCAECGELEEDCTCAYVDEYDDAIEDQP